MPLEGFTPWPEELAREYKGAGAWPEITLYETLDRWVREAPQREAVVDENTRLTFGQLGRSIQRLALALHSLGIRKGDRVMVQLPNQVEFLYFFYALAKIGAIPVLTIPQFREKDVDYLLKLTQAVAVIIPGEYRGFDHTRMMAAIGPGVPTLKHVIVVSDSVPQGMTSYGELMKRAWEEEFPAGFLDEFKPIPDDVAFICLTGGTTAFPKGVPHTHNNFLGNRIQYAQRNHWGPDTITLVNKPIELYASLGRAISVLMMGGKVIIRTSARAEVTLQAVEQEKVTEFILVPTEAVDILALPDVERYDLSSLTHLVCGISAFTPDQLQTLGRRMGAQILKAYGMTEGIVVLTLPEDPPELVLKVNGIPCCEHDDYRIVDEEGNEVPRGREGELVARGPHLFRGYYKAPEENRKAFDQNGFFHTGDFAVMDEQGYIRISGRKKDWIRRGGQTIIPLEVEEPLLSHPKIENAAVVAMPDPRLGERACAYIQPRPGQSLTLEEVAQYLQEKGLAKYKLPERIELVTALPQKGLGKVDKKLLQEEIAQKLQAEGKT